MNYDEDEYSDENMDPRPFYKVLFNEGEHTCFAKDVYGTLIYPTSIITPTNNHFPFFSINPLQVSRADVNCTAFRNILIEFDSIPLREQREMIAASGLPYSSCVFSGGKSFHYIIALNESLNSVEEYKQLVKRVHKNLPGCDTSTSNPSRLSRTPGCIRKNGSEQALISLTKRVPLEDLLAWLGDEPEPVVTKVQRTAMRGHRVVNGFTNHFLMFGAEQGQRNRQLFNAACDMIRAGYSTDEIFDKVIDATDLDKKEVIATIRSALRAARDTGTEDADE